MLHALTSPFIITLSYVTTTNNTVYNDRTIDTQINTIVLVLIITIEVNSPKVHICDGRLFNQQV